MKEKHEQFDRWDVDDDGKIYWPEFWKGIKRYTKKSTGLKIPENWKKSYFNAFKNITGKDKDYYTWSMLKKWLTEIEIKKEKKK